MMYLSAPLSPADVPNPALVTAGLRKTYGTGAAKVRALAGIDLGIERGKLTSIMGPSGSGKSTLLHCLAGLDTVTSGEIRIAGRVITQLSEKDLTVLRRDNFGFIFQSYNLLPALTVAENITLPTKISGRTVPPVRLDAVASSVGLQGLLDRLPAELSGGQQQRVAAARALFTQPQILFADEPTGNLDTQAGEDLLQLLRSAVDDTRQTVLMVTHDPRAAAWSDRIIFLRDGQIAGELLHPQPKDVLSALGELDRPLAAEEQPALSSETTATTPFLPVAEPPPLQLPGLSLETLDDLAPPTPLSPQAAEVVDRATSILEHLGGSVIDPEAQAESTPQISGERDTL